MVDHTNAKLNGHVSANGKATRRDDPRYRVSFDPACPDLLRPLTQQENAIVLIYAYHVARYGVLPAPEQKFGAINRAARELAIDSELVKQVSLERFAFVDLFPHNPDIAFHTAARRLIGFGAGKTTKEECAAALLWLSDEMTKEIQREDSSAERVIPNTADVRKAAYSNDIVPGLHAPMPLPTAISRHFNGTWNEVAAEVLGASEKQIRATRPLYLTIDDVIADYQAAYAHYYGEFSVGDENLVTTEQLDQFREHGGLGARRYQSFFRREIKADPENHVNLDVIREKAGLPVQGMVSDHRRETQKWSRVEVYAGFAAAWNLLGRDGDPPSLKALNEMSRKQTRIFNKHGRLDAISCRSVGVPTTFVPSQKSICSIFNGMVELLGYAERIAGKPIEFSDAARKGRMAGEVLKRNIPHGKVPVQIAEHARSLSVAR